MSFARQIVFHSILVLFVTATVSANAHEHKHKHEKPPKEFVHGITIKLGHDLYHFSGPPDGPNGESDVPGHKWLKVGKNRFLGKHFNTGPFGAPNFWSSDAGDGALLYVMDAVIDKWSEVKALQYFMKGYAHYHTLVNVRTGLLHPKKVVWFKHVAVKDFKFDGPDVLAFNGMEAYEVSQGVDYKMAPKWDVPYNPNPTR